MDLERDIWRGALIDWVSGMLIAGGGTFIVLAWCL